VEEIFADEPDDVPAAYLGDDLTDEDAFVAVGTRDIPSWYEARFARSFARFWLHPPDELLISWTRDCQFTKRSSTVAARIS